MGRRRVGCPSETDRGEKDLASLIAPEPRSDALEVPRAKMRVS
jgi:hypothetical protein